jgi:N-acetylmuramate 1-kinase
MWTCFTPSRTGPSRSGCRYYRSAFEQVDRLFYAKPPKDFHLMPPFDAALYRWEQNYFFEYLVEDFLGMDASSLRENPVFTGLAERLGTGARHLVHRDFQSQNLLIKDDRSGSSISRACAAGVRNTIWHR